jgi:hypothetical protein
VNVRPNTIFRDPTAWVPIAISLAALLFVLGFAATVGVAPHDDEGMPARLFQLAMAIQVVVIVVFAVRWLPRAPREAGVVLAVQLIAAAVPLIAVSLLEASL